MKLVPRRMRDYSGESMSGRVSVHGFRLQDEDERFGYWAEIN